MYVRSRHCVLLWNFPLIDHQKVGRDKRRQHPPPGVDPPPGLMDTYSPPYHGIAPHGGGGIPTPPPSPIALAYSWPLLPHHHVNRWWRQNRQPGMRLGRTAHSLWTDRCIIVNISQRPHPDMVRGQCTTFFVF